MLPIPRRIAETCNSQIRAVYYFGDACPMSVWDSFRRELVDIYLTRIRSDGFNTIILLVPVCMVQLKNSKSTYYRKFLDDLLFILKKCRTYSLYYAFRLFYVWDSYPLNLNRLEWTYRIYAKNDVGMYEAVLADLVDLVGEDSSFLFGFTTWEDLTPQLTIALPGSAKERRLEVGKLINLPIEKFPDKAIPATTSPVFCDYLAYVDDLFVSVNKSLRSIFPLLTAEVRVDVTPYKNTDSTISYFEHGRQIAIGSDLGFVGTYYATYMGARNEDDEIDATFAFNTFEISQSKALSLSGGRVFVDQLLLRIGQEKFAHFSRLPKDEIEIFVFDYLADWFAKYGVGYANWSYQDYMLAAVSNAAFQLDLDGWTVDGSVKLNKERQLELTGPAMLTQKRLTRRVQKAYVKIDFVTIEDALIDIELGDGQVLKIDYRGNKGNEIIFYRSLDCVASKFSLSLQSGHCVLHRCALGWDHHSNGGYGIDSTVGEVSEVLAKFNSRLGEIGFV